MIHAATLEAAEMDCDSEGIRAWILTRYKKRFHPLPVYFAERFHEWNMLPQVDRETQIELEVSNPIEAKFTPAGAITGEGILRFQERFGRTCAVAAVDGDREFFRVFHAVSDGLASGGFPITLDVEISRAHFLLKHHTETATGENPTTAEICDHLEKSPFVPVGYVPTELPRKVNHTLAKTGLAKGKGKVGGDRRSRGRK